MIPLAAIDSRAVTALVVSGGIALFGLLLIATAAGELRGRRKAKVPAGFRPGPSDEELEKHVIERYLVWGSAATLLIALWIPALWLYEPTRLQQKETRYLNEAIVRGEKLYGEFLCNTCHGKEGAGGQSQFIIDGVTHNYAEPPLKYIYSRYQEAGRNEDEITQLILDAINRGRPGTPMPTWGLFFGGPLNSQQVEDLALYIQSIQDDFPTAEAGATGAELFDANCAVCHGAAGEGGIGPNLTVAFDRLTRKQVRTTIETGRLNTNRPSMPSWAALGDDAVEALVRFIESIQRSR